RRRGGTASGRRGWDLGRALRHDLRAGREHHGPVRHGVRRRGGGTSNMTHVRRGTPAERPPAGVRVLTDVAERVWHRRREGPRQTTALWGGGDGVLAGARR